MHVDALKALEIMPQPFTAEDYSRIMRVHVSTARRALREMRRAGHIVRVGGGPASPWVYEYPALTRLTSSH